MNPSSYTLTHPFDRSGAAALSDLNTPEWRELFDRLERDQTTFLARQAEFRSPEYPWPRDPLHNWSRCWEYPYTAYHLERFRAHREEKSSPVAVDLGSGVTFFPFSVARMGYDVVCVDVDPICQRDLARAIPLMNRSPGQVSFRLTDGTRLPLQDAEADVVYCVSVLEHIPNFVATVREIARVLKPGGLCILTNDLDLRGDQEIGVEPYQRLLGELNRHFEYRHPAVTVHPADLLLTRNGPWRIPTPVGWRKAWFLVKQNVLKPVFGRKPRRLLEYDLAVTAFSLVRRPA